MVEILVDDTKAEAMLGDWETILSNSSVGGSMQYAGSVGSSMTLEFSGTAISFFGPVNTSSVSPQIGSITIDGQTVDSRSASSVQQNISGLATVEDTRWYQSHMLSDSAHSISFNDLKFVFFDYAVVNAGENTRLNGENIIFDDGDAALVYEGNWTPFEGETIIVNRTITVSPFGNSTHKTRDPGSSATFKFSGTAISVFGEYIPTANVAKRSTGSMAVRYTLDGFATDLSYASTTIPAMNLLLFSNNSIDVGEHTLSIQLTDTSDSDLALDYIVYTASETPSSAPPPHGDTLRNILIGSIAGGVLVIIALMDARQEKEKKNVSFAKITNRPNIGSINLRFPILMFPVTTVRIATPRANHLPVNLLFGGLTNDPNLAEPMPPPLYLSVRRENTADISAGNERANSRSTQRVPHDIHGREEYIPINPRSEDQERRTNATPLPPPAYEQGSVFKGEDGRLRDFLDRVQ
ncbi:hypothetical protein DXG01_012582 [Tephrocybe rancida]|nr:hypothetical protein DXG01_012582 [Tephrocybe rancida]